MEEYKANSKELFETAKSVIPGGVNSPVRAFRAVGGAPLFIASANGSKITSIEERSYIDYVSSWGAIILGHSHPEINSAIHSASLNGTSFGAPSPLEVQLAQKIADAVPCVEKVRFVNSGTEAVMSAVRLARAYTGRKKIIKFSGAYHGHADYLLSEAGSGLATFGIPSSPGVPEEFVRLTISAPYNNLTAIKEIMDKEGDSVAAIIVEPAAGNMGVVPPKEGFLDRLKNLCREHGSLLIFDEVITGFRLSYGGAQDYYSLTPDLVTLGKIIGGGLPVGAYGGAKKIMDLVAPEGNVYQAGTLSGNPLAMSAGIAALNTLKKENPYKTLEEKAKALEAGIRKIAAKHDVPVTINRASSLLTVFFTDEPVTDYASALSSNTERFARFFRTMLDEGVYLPPSQFEAWFLTTAHTDEDIQKTLQAAEKSFKKL